MEFNNPSMIVKDILTGEDARAKIMSGVHQLADAVKSTLGASGKCVIFEDAQGQPVITKDGVTVAESIVLYDAVENMGATMIKEAASKTVREAGDGTTTAIVLTQALLRVVNDYKGEASIREIKEGITKATDEVIAYLDTASKKVKGDMLKHVAAISCNNDPVLGALINEAFTQAGLDGEVLMEDSADNTTTVETTKGAQLQECGLKSQYLRTNAEQETAELENPYILILTSPLGNLRKIESVLEFVVKKNKALLIIGELEQHPMATLVSNKVKGILKVNVIDLPGFGPTKQDTIEDVAFLTGAKVISEELGDDMDFIGPDVLGRCDRAVTNNSRTILQINDTPDGVYERIDTVKKKIKKEKNGYIKKKLEDRLNILSGSVSLIKVGAETKLELKEKKDRIEDAIYAVKAAIKEGVVAGGGVALMDASFAGSDRLLSPGEKLLREAIQAPFFSILTNADTDMSGDFLEFLKTRKNGQGVDVVKGDFVDMIKRGIIDPVLVTKTALKNAVSVVTTIISADAILSNRRIEQ